MQRDIRWVRSPGKNQVGPEHQNRFLIEPGHWEEHDPFLMLAEDWFPRGTFGPHPHRGMETVTYVLEGRLEHEDNRGGKDVLGPGDAQWMTAGRGVIHSEEPVAGDTVHSLQLWLNLPSKDKMSAPRYQTLRGDGMPVRSEAGVTVKLFSGTASGMQSDTRNIVPVTMAELELEPGAETVQELPGSYNGFLYVLEGEGRFGRDAVHGSAGQVLWLGSAADGRANSQVRIRAETPLRVLLYAGLPIGEPVFARGPFVMNTKEEIVQAYRDYQEGKFA